jgi:DNA-binding beta-propeller fold protein YncE
MRATRSLAFVVVLVLSACATETQREEQRTTVAAPEATPSSLDWLGSPAHTGHAATSPTAPARPRTPTASASGPAGESWPAPLRTLHLNIPAGNSYQPKAMAVHPGLNRVYVRTDDLGANGQGLVTVIDLSSTRVVTAVATAPDSASDGGMVVDTVRDRVYAINAGMATASVLDARTLGVIETLPDVLLLALDDAGGRVYVAGRASLRVLEAERFETLAQAPLPSGALWLALGLNTAADRLYLAGRLSPEGNRLQVYDTADLTRIASTALPGGPESLVVDRAEGRVYIALNGGSNSLLLVLDADGRALDERDQGRWAGRTGLALDDEGRRLFLAHESYADHMVTVLDPATWQKIAAISLPLSPYSLTWDAHSHRLLISHPGQNAIGVANVEAGRVEAIVATAVELVDLEVDPARGHVYITDRAGRLRVFDSDTDAELATLPAQGIISVDSPHGRLYTGGGDRGVPVRVFDAERLEQIGMIAMLGAQPVADPHSGGLYLVRDGVYIASLETMTVTGVISDTLPPPEHWNPSPAAVGALVDPGTGRLFVVMNTGSTSTSNGNYLNVYEPITHWKAYSDSELSVGYLDLDPVSGRAYVSRIYMDNRSISLLENAWTYIARLDGQYGPLRVDPGLGRLYVDVDPTMGQQPAQLLVLDAGSLRTIGSVPVPAGLALYALDPERHILYLASYEGEVQIWSATGGQLPSP